MRRGRPFVRTNDCLPPRGTARLAAVTDYVALRDAVRRAETESSFCLFAPVSAWVWRSFSWRCQDMRWCLSHRADPEAVAIADRHYNRQKIGSRQFVPPGRCLVFKTICGRALWVTSWPFPQYVRHAWAGACINSLFRNEGAGLSSELILEAVAATRAYWEPPSLGMITFVDPDKTRRKRDPGRCYRKAGFRHVGFTAGGLWAFQLLPEFMPSASRPSARLPLFTASA